MKENPQAKRKTVKERIADNLKRQAVHDLASDSDGDDLSRASSGSRASPEASSKNGASSLKLRASMSGVLMQKMRGSFATQNKNLEVPGNDKRSSMFRRSSPVRKNSKKGGALSARSGGFEAAAKQLEEIKELTPQNPFEKNLETDVTHNIQNNLMPTDPEDDDGLAILQKKPTIEPFFLSDQQEFKGSFALRPQIEVAELMSLARNAPEKMPTVSEFSQQSESSFGAESELVQKKRSKRESLTIFIDQDMDQQQQPRKVSQLGPIKEEDTTKKRKSTSIVSQDQDKMPNFNNIIMVTNLD